LKIPVNLAKRRCEIDFSPTPQRREVNARSIHHTAPWKRVRDSAVKHILRSSEVGALKL